MSEGSKDKRSGGRCFMSLAAWLAALGGSAYFLKGQGEKAMKIFADKGLELPAAAASALRFCQFHAGSWVLVGIVAAVSIGLYVKAPKSRIALPALYLTLAVLTAAGTGLVWFTLWAPLRT